jgi:hypothetical protein
MTHDLTTVAAILRRTAGLGVENLNQLLGPLLLTIALLGCGSPASRDVLAYDACITRHPQEIALCEGPRQAYELDPTAFEASVAGVSGLTNNP